MDESAIIPEKSFTHLVESPKNPALAGIRQTRLKIFPSLRVFYTCFFETSCYNVDTILLGGKSKYGSQDY